MSTIREYYGRQGSYISDHVNYLTDENLKRDSQFIIESLKLTKQDNCLDMQCAQGRLTVELKSKGFNVDGLDFSSYMIDLAQQLAKSKGLNIDFFIKDLNQFKLRKKYSKVFIFFPEWTDLNFEKILPNVHAVLKKGGLFLYDHDGLFRAWSYLEQNPNKRNRFTFDPQSMMLKENRDKIGDRYYVYPELENIFKQSGFEIISTYGDWTIEGGEYKYNSPRIRIVAKKI